MGQRNYQTIDPLIMQTLNLNEKRIHHIFDILHGRDIQPQTNRSYHYQQKNISLKQIQSHQRAKSPRQISLRGDKTERLRVSSVKKVSSPRNLSRISEIEGKKEKKLIEERHEDGPATQKNQRLKSIQREEKLFFDYGRLRKNKSQEINPKDLYRLQTENILSRLVQIEDMEGSQKQMKRLKRRYKHLQRFDREYYSKLNQADLVLI